MNRVRILSQITEGTEGTVEHGETEQRRTNGEARATSGRHNRPHAMSTGRRTHKPRDPLFVCARPVGIASPRGGLVARPPFVSVPLVLRVNPFPAYRSVASRERGTPASNTAIRLRAHRRAT